METGAPDAPFLPRVALVNSQLGMEDYKNDDMTPFGVPDSTELAVRRAHRPEFIEGPKSELISPPSPRPPSRLSQV